MGNTIQLLIESGGAVHTAHHDDGSMTFSPISQSEHDIIAFQMFAQMLIEGDGNGYEILNSPIKSKDFLVDYYLKIIVIKIE